MKRIHFVRALSGLALLAVVLGAAALQTESADAQTPFLSAGGPYVGAAGVPLQFSAAGNISGVTGVYWTFGDGSSDRGFTAIKSFAAPGVYPVTVTVTNIFGQTFSATTTATVGGAGQACQAVGPQLAQVDPRGVDFGRPSTIPVVQQSVVCAPGALVPSATMVNHYCYTVWVVYNPAAAMMAGCR